MLLALLLACQPCPKTFTADEISRGASLIAILQNGKLTPAPKDGPPRPGSFGSFTAEVVTVLKGSITAKKITVRWDYGMCSYPAPSVGKEPTVVFLSGGGKDAYAPGAAGCGPVQLGYDEKTKTIAVDGEALTVSEFKKRYGK